MANEDSGLNVVFGASGGLGSAVVRVLAAQGKRVRAVNRRGQAEVPAGVERAAGNASYAASAREACKDAAVVFHCANAPYTDWPRSFPPMTDNIMAAAAAADAKLVFGDNLYAYGPARGKMTEDLPYAATGPKGRTRALMANKLLEAHRAGKVRVTIGRASDFYGPNTDNAAMGDRVLRPTIEGGTINLLGNPGLPHTYSFVDDVARGLVTLSEHEKAFGEVWHIPSAETITTRQFLEILFEEAGRRAQVRVAPKFVVTVMGWFNPMMREIKEMVYEWEQPYIVDHSKFERAFGAEPTPHREAIRRTLAWYRAHPTE